MHHLIVLAATGLVLGAWPALAVEETLKPTLESVVREALPVKLQPLEPGKTSQKETYKILGRPYEKKGKHAFYRLVAKRFDLTVTFEGGKLAHLYHELEESSLRYRNIEEWVSPAQRKSIEKDLNPSKGAHDAGRTFKVDYPDKGIKLEFSNNESRELRSILLYKPARKK